MANSRSPLLRFRRLRIVSWGDAQTALAGAATIAGFAASPFTAVAVPEINAAIAHLRDVLGDPAYESLARAGEKMTTAAMATDAYGQIDQARASLHESA